MKLCVEQGWPAAAAAHSERSVSSLTEQAQTWQVPGVTGDAFNLLFASVQVLLPFGGTLAVIFGLPVHKEGQAAGWA